MKVVGVLLAGAGAYLMYYAVRNTTPHPVSHAKTSLGKLAKGTSTNG